MGDSAYDGEPIDKQPDAQAIILPHITAVVSNAGDTQRDQHIQTICHFPFSQGNGWTSTS
jgi:hypothetical protein